MTNSIEEILNTDAIFVIGSNTTENHPVIGTVMKRAKRGSKTNSSRSKKRLNWQNMQMYSSDKTRN